jgi:thioredoxin-like negative regulator of GroEL
VLAQAGQRYLPVPHEVDAALLGRLRDGAADVDAAVEGAGAWVLAKVDVDAESELAGGFGVSSIPTIALFEPGEQPKAVVGALPKEMLESAFELDRFAKK